MYASERVTPFCLSTFQYQTHFPQGARPWFADRCLTCKLEYSANVEGDYVILSITAQQGGTRRELRLPKPITIEVRNIAPKEDEKKHVNHFHYYYRIFEKQDCRRPLPDLEVKKECKPFCLYPDNRFPQADCTQTGHP